MGNPAGELDVLEARATSPCASEITLPCSAVISRRDVVAVPVEQIAEAEEDRGPLRQRRGAPLPERARRGLDGGVHLGGRGEVNGARLLTGRRVVDRAVLPEVPATT